MKEGESSRVGGHYWERGALQLNDIAISTAPVRDYERRKNTSWHSSFFYVGHCVTLSGFFAEYESLKNEV